MQAVAGGGAEAAGGGPTTQGKALAAILGEWCLLSLPQGVPERVFEPYLLNCCSLEEPNPAPLPLVCLALLQPVPQVTLLGGHFLLVLSCSDVGTGVLGSVPGSGSFSGCSCAEKKAQYWPSREVEAQRRNQGCSLGRLARHWGGQSSLSLAAHLAAHAVCIVLSNPGPFLRPVC